VCPGKYLTLTGDGATFYSWSGGVVNGFAFAAPSATTTYTLTGTMGACSNTATKTVTVNPKPTSTFTLQNESFSGYCDGSIVAHLVGGTGTTQTQWFVGQTILTTDSIGGLCPGSYTLHLTDSQGCENDYVETILTGLIPPTPSICLVTVDSAHIHNLIVWEKTNLNMVPIDSFIIYREFGANNYHRIDAVSKNSLSFYDDLGANPASTGYRYKLKCKNALGVESLFSNYHNTIYLTNNDANFSWTQYQIENNNTPVSTYNIYRDDNSTGNFQNIGFTSGNQFGYTDLNFTSHPNASYYVEAVMSAGVCSPSRTSYSGSSSNVKHVGSNGIQKLNNTLAINIYPNPAANIFYIKGITGKTSILLYDVVGKLIIKKEVENNTSINTNQLTEGIYMLSSENQLGSTFYKIIICR
jgi:hypothetical protein